MFYLHPGDDVEEASLVDPSGSWLSVTWNRSFAPYLGIWADHGHFTRGRVLAIEPASGFFDELNRAYQNGTVTRFASGKSVSWWVEVTVGQGEERCKSS
jgi:galactose mutarotase-like enzyme